MTEKEVLGALRKVYDKIYQDEFIVKPDEKDYSRRRPHIFVRFVLSYYLVRHLGVDLAKSGAILAKFYGRSKPWTHCTLINSVKVVGNASNGYDFWDRKMTEWVKNVLDIDFSTLNAKSNMIRIASPILHPTQINV